MLHCLIFHLLSFYLAPFKQVSALFPPLTAVSDVERTEGEIETWIKETEQQINSFTSVCCKEKETEFIY